MKLHEVLQSVLEYDRDEVDLEPRGVRDKMDVPSGRTGDERGHEKDNPVVSKMRSAAEEIIGQDMEVLGNGNFGIAFGSASDSSRAIRVTKRARSYDGLKNDGYLRWVGGIVKSGMNLENPYVPRIYGVHFKKNAENRYGYVVETEKLIDDFDMDGEHDAALLRVAAERIFGEDRIEKLVDQFEIEDNVDAWYFFLDSLIRDSYERNGALIKDKRLVQAFELVKKISGWRDGDSHDIGGPNMMYRRTPHGLYPVLIDPIYG